MDNNDVFCELYKVFLSNLNLIGRLIFASVIPPFSELSPFTHFFCVAIHVNRQKRKTNIFFLDILTCIDCLSKFSHSSDYLK